MERRGVEGGGDNSSKRCLSNTMSSQKFGRYVIYKNHVMFPMKIPNISTSTMLRETEKQHFALDGT